MTINEWVELLQVLDDAVENAMFYLSECREKYGPSYRPQRLAAANKDYELAKKMRDRVKLAVDEVRQQFPSEVRE